jgi:hypothetical protein
VSEAAADGDYRGKIEQPQRERMPALLVVEVVRK